MKVNAFRFSSSASPEKPDVLQGKTPEEFLRLKYQRGCFFGLDTLQRNGHYRLLGWAFDFQPFMKKFLVKQHYEWSEYWAPNRTALRKSIFGKIQNIVDIPAKAR